MAEGRPTTESDADQEVCEALRRALADDRAVYNARFENARSLRPGLSSAAFTEQLRGPVNALVSAVDAHDPSAASAATAALYDLSLELVGHDLVGPSQRYPEVEAAWSSLLPRLAPFVAAEPRRVAAAITNAAYNLAVETGVDADQWMLELYRVSRDCQTVDELLAAGQVLSWTAGMAHYRESARRVWDGLRDELKIATLAPGSDVSVEALTKSLDSRWCAPSSAPDQPEIGVVARVGGFRGFGGPFMKPPKVLHRDGALFAHDGLRAFSVHADFFGAILRPAEMPEAEERQPKGPHDLSRSGKVRIGDAERKLPQLRGATSHASTEDVLAVTRKHSHFVWLVAVR